ncbi:MAG: hypothetical protein HKP48_05485 [Winogradskyella sp.]|uniref:hypothetical protein n=1 Tax=Winogradskyella sp. TaxID=1883156 RepID=UPI0017F62CE9|nr:hypothetical protein [Winogradskyella sp.]MBT8244356.1 hypothetical protein [Winogradskyella sp.]NNK22751.1 hypothetical protein [Winogradskyella sp.]
MKSLFLFFVSLSISCFSQNKIEKIEFNTNGYANEPDFSIIIYRDRTAIFIAKNNNYEENLKGDVVGFGTNEKGYNIRNSEIKGVFKVKLKKTVFNEIIMLIKNLKQEFKKGNFISNQIHNSEATLIVSKEKNKSNSITDIGMRNNKNLMNLYNYLKKLRFNQSWK